MLTTTANISSCQSAAASEILMIVGLESSNHSCIRSPDCYLYLYLKVIHLHAYMKLVQTSRKCRTSLTPAIGTKPGPGPTRSGC